MIFGFWGTLALFYIFFSLVNHSKPVKLTNQELTIEIEKETRWGIFIIVILGVSIFWIVMLLISGYI